MPVYRPTASSIWNSFRSSGKRHLVLTGALHRGKTTLLSELFPEGLPGITTWAEPYEAVFMKDNSTGESIKIAEYDHAIQGTKLKMVLIGDRMSSFGISILRRCMQSEIDWISIDEIGFLEENCEPIKAAIRELFDQKQVVAIVRKQDLPFLRELRERNDVFLVDLDQPFGNRGGVIMASGMGNRGGGNKLMADFHGEPLITRILDATEGLFAKRVVVTRHEDVAALCKARGIQAVYHDLPYRSDTVRLGLEAVGDTERCMFCPGDQPLLKKDTVASLLLCSVNNPDTMWRPCCDGTPGSPVVFPSWAFPELMALPEGKGGGFVAKKYPDKMDMLHITDSWELTDVDTRETLELLKGRLS